MRYKITLSYKGKGFCGWQIQDNAPTVQGSLEDALQVLLRVPVGITGAGRTDTDVNAVNYVAHFDLPEPSGNLPVPSGDLSESGLISNDRIISDTVAFIRKLNGILPRGITVHSIEPVSNDFHARFSATSRQYKYYIHNFKNCYLDDISWHCHYKLDVERMNKACALLPGTHDCSCFEKKGSDNTSSICDIKYARWDIVPFGNTDCGLGTWLPMLTSGPVPQEPQVLLFTIEANRFLRNMVRAIVGTLVDIGRGAHEPEYIKELFENGTRSDAGQSVPGHALFLTKIEY